MDEITKEPSKDLDALRVGDRVRWRIPYFDKQVELKGRVTDRSQSGIQINWDNGNWGKFDRKNQVIWNVELDREYGR